MSNQSKIAKCQIYGAPPLNEYDWSHFPPRLSLFKDVHEINASMALQISNYFLTRKLPKKEADDKNNELIPMAKGFKVSLEQALGLRLCKWPGRSQKVLKETKTFFLDGAHTEQSMWACRTWFDHVLSQHSDPSKRILIFNSTGDRKAEILLAPLLTFPFDLVIFCTNVTKEDDLGSDNTNLNYSMKFSLQKCETNKRTWDQLQDAKVKNNLDVPKINVKVPSQVVTHIEDALKIVPENSHVYVTGSLHLVGGVLSFIQPDCYELSEQELSEELKITETYKELHRKSSRQESAIFVSKAQ